MTTSRTPDPHVDYGPIDLDNPKIKLVVEQDHRNGVHHYGLACCEPVRRDQ